MAESAEVAAHGSASKTVSASRLQSGAVNHSPGAPRPTADAPALLYVIHAAADHELAKLLRMSIKDHFPETDVFLASKAGDIPTGKDWLAYIHEQLAAATTF